MEVTLYVANQNENKQPSENLIAEGFFHASQTKTIDQPIIPQPAIPESTEIAISFPLPKVKPSVSFIKNLCFGLITGSFLLLFYFSFPIISQELSYRLSKPQETVLVESPYKVMFEIANSQKQKQVNEEAIKWNVNTNFSIVIPKINASANIISNVNPADEKLYKEALVQGVSHAAGTNFPGNGGLIYLFSHSTNSTFNIARYNAVFYLVKELNSGDEIIIFYTGRKYQYKVIERLITTADDTKWLMQESSEEILVLQTCWPPGTSLKRLIVVAKPIVQAEN